MCCPSYNHLSVLWQLKTICMFDVLFLTSHLYWKNKYYSWPQTVLFFLITKKMLNYKYWSLKLWTKVVFLPSDTRLLVYCGRLCAPMKVINAQSWLQRDNNILWHFLSYIMLCLPFFISKSLQKREIPVPAFPI